MAIKLRFNDGNPGKDWISGFYNRHKSSVRFRRASKHCGIIPLRLALGERRRCPQGSTPRGHAARIDPIQSSSRKGRGSLA